MEKLLKTFETQGDKDQNFFPVLSVERALQFY